MAYLFTSESVSEGHPDKVSDQISDALVDHFLAFDPQSAANSYATQLVESGAPLKRVRDITIDPASVEEGFFEAARKKLARRARGQIAQDRIVSCIEAAVKLPMDEGLKRERELFGELVTSPESAAMRHIFFAERQATKIKGLSKDTPRRPVDSVAIIGAGTMGGGIAMCFANVGIPVKLLEVSEDALERGLGIVRKNYAITVSKGKMSEADMEKRIALINGTTSYDDLSDVDLVIEAVFENLDLKKEIFAKLDSVCKPGAILATNTSYQDVNAIASATSRPQDVLGMHFFSPANVMKLLENVRGDQTADDVVATAMAIGKKIGKVCALSGVCYGFIGNRMLGGYGREAQMLLLDGCTPSQVDGALERFGMAMGPLAMGDLAGLDVGYKARQARTDLPDDPRLYRMGTVLVEMERFGQKTGSGFYKYDPQTRARLDDPEVEAMIKKEAAALGVEQREISDDEILARCLYPLINEGAKILEEGIAQRASDIDVVYVFGYAFPVAKGGPMFYADQVGLKNVYDKICEFRERYGDDYWAPAPLLEKLAAEGSTFAEWSASQE